MKKLLAIMVLGLLMSGCATSPSKVVQKQLIDQGNIKIGMDLKTVLQILPGSYNYFPFRYADELNYTYILPNTGNWNDETYMYGFKADAAVKKDMWGIPKSFKLVKIWNSKLDMLDAYLKIATHPKDIASLTVDKTYVLRNIENKRNNESSSSASSSSNTNKVAEAKLACTDLGFKPQTEKFAECALKFVTLDFERTTSAKNEPQVVIHKNDVNVWDELGVLFRQQGIIQDTSRPVNTRTNMRCTSSKTGFGQVVTNCR